MPTIKESIALIKNELIPLVGKSEAGHFAWLIFDYLRGYSRTDILLKEQEPLSYFEARFVNDCVARLKTGEPLQYVLGITEFLGLKIKVDSRVLIPRPETEELVEWIISDNTANNPVILDIGTGSGCIPVSLKKNITGATIYAWEISEESINLACENAKLNNAEVSFKQVDVLNYEVKNGPCFDIVVSNPPYVTETEKPGMAPNVLDYEPHLALFVPNNNPLVFYDRIATLSTKLLNPGGKLFFEINRSYGNEVATLLKSKGFIDVSLRKDISGHDRMVKAVWPTY